MGEKMRELLDKNRKRKKKEIPTAITAVGTKTSRFVNNSDRFASYFENFVLMEDTKTPHQVQVTKSMF